jgi:hypothetical protein
MAGVPVVVGLTDAYTRDSLKSAVLETPNYTFMDLQEDLGGDTSSIARGVLWLEYEDLPFDQLVMKSENVMGNSYCIRKGLIRKSQMAYMVTKYISKHEDSVLRAAVPETYQFEMDDPYYFEEAMAEVFEVAASLRENEERDASERTRWILKPSITNKVSMHVQ